MPASFAAPGGRDYLQIRSAHPDPSRRFHVSMSDTFLIGADGLREMAEWLVKFANEADPADADKLVLTKPAVDPALATEQTPEAAALAKAARRGTRSE